MWDLAPSQAGKYQYDVQREALGKIASDVRKRMFFGADEPTARQIVLNGFPEGAKAVQELAAKIKEVIPPPKSRRRMRKWGEEGDEVGIERYIAQNENMWQSTHRKLCNACGLVELVVPWGLDCGASFNQLKWAGAAALAVTDLLEQADYSVEVALVAGMQDWNGATNEPTWSIVRVDLKQMGELLDLEKLAVAVYPPSWRLYGLCSFQQAPWGLGSDYNEHPHGNPLGSEMFAGENKSGMWDYRPNVMTVVLKQVKTEFEAIATAVKAISNLDKLVNPEEHQHA